MCAWSPNGTCWPPTSGYSHGFRLGEASFECTEHLRRIGRKHCHVSRSVLFVWLSAEEYICLLSCVMKPLILRQREDLSQLLCVTAWAGLSSIMPAPGFLLHVASRVTFCVCSAPACPSRGNDRCSRPRPHCPICIFLRGFSVTHNQQRPHFI